MLVKIFIGRQPLLFTEEGIVWEKVYTEEDVRNLLVQCEDEHGNIVYSSQANDPETGPEE